MKLKYTTLTEEDRAFFIRLYNATYRNNVLEEIPGWDKRLHHQDASRVFDEGNMHMILQDHKQVGVIGCACRHDQLWLKELLLLPEYQREGIGSQVIKDVITKARSLAKDISFRSLRANLRAKKLYERFGFSVVETNDTHLSMFLPFTVPEFKTERLLLKPVTVKDKEAYQKHFVDYEIIRNLSSHVPWPYPDEGVEYFLNTLIFPYQGNTQWLWGLFLKTNPDELIGAIHLWREGKPENRGFWLSRIYQGKGLMTEAVKPVMDYAFTDLAFEKLIFSNAVGNKKSRRIKEKTGAKFLRVEPMKFVDPQFTEHEIWELDATDWCTDRRNG